MVNEKSPESFILRGAPVSSNLNGLDDRLNCNKSRIGLVVGSAFGITGIALVALTTPFILPALRRHCLPYVPATNRQLSNLSRAFKRHGKKGDSFLDIGSGDGRLCRLAARTKIFSQVHGVELNYILVLFSRILALKEGQYGEMKYFHKDLWRFNLSDYDAICIFGVESMMEPLDKRLKELNKKSQTIFACRFPFSNLPQIDQIGEGIDTVWVYKLDKNKYTSLSQ